MKRFYKNVTIAEQQGGHQILLDGRAIKTALGNPQILPGITLAETMAAEWDAQGEEIDGALFRHRDIADFAIDKVGSDKDGTVTKLLAFAETDTLCYRADPDEPFYRRQMEVWEPVLTEFEKAQGIRFERVSGIVHKQQPPESLKRLGEKLGAIDPFALAALQAMTSLAASLCIGMSALEESGDPEALWSAANLEEDWQVEQWGHDHEAELVRARRKADFLIAWEFARLARA